VIILSQDKQWKARNQPGYILIMLQDYSAWTSTIRNSGNVNFMFCWPCILVQLWVNEQLDAQLRYVILYYYNPLHVSSNCVLIIRRSNCVNTASGIVFSVSDHPVCKVDFLLNLHTGRSLIIRRSNCINTASGIVFSLSDHPVCRLRRNWWTNSFSTRNLHTGRSLTENTVPNAALTFWRLM